MIKMPRLCFYIYHKFWMNILEASFRYFDDIMNDNRGVKAVVTDPETLTVLSLAMTRTELFSQDVIQISEISEACGCPFNEIICSLKCVIIIRPTAENIDYLMNELSYAPHYSRYCIYFTNYAKESQIKALAQSDKFALVDYIGECFIDYYPLNSHLFSLNFPSILDLRLNKPSPNLISRISDGVFASICALQMRPMIRYAGSSTLCRQIAFEVANRASNNSYSDITNDAVLIILDRKSDPIAALLHPWFYSGAIHELFTIKNNLISLPSKTEPIVFDERHDSFIREYCCKFLADVGPAIAQKMNEAKALNEKAKQVIRTPDQIADVVDAATKFQEQFQVAESHVSIIDAINKEVTNSPLLSVSELEQSISMCDDPNGHCNQILQIIPQISSNLALRLIMIFALRYEGRSQELHSKLWNASPESKSYMSTIIQTCGTSMRGSDDVFVGKTGISQLFKDIKMLVEADQKMLDQYKVLLISILNRVKKGQLSSEQYPFVGGIKGEQLHPKRVVVFYVGGATYYEMRAACDLSSTDFSVVVGGTTVHNAESFIKNEIEPFLQ